MEKQKNEADRIVRLTWELTQAYKNLEKTLIEASEQREADTMV